MNYKNLKIHTAFNLFGVIVVSMLLINLVVVVFWYEHLVQQNIKSSTLLINYTLAAVSNEDSKGGHNSANSSLTNLIENDEHHIRRIVFKKVLLSKQRDTSVTIRKLDHEMVSMKSLLNFLKSDDNDTGFLKTSRNKVYALPPEDEVLVGFSFDTSHITSQIWKKQKIIILYIVFNALVLSTILFFRFRKILFTPMDNLINIANNYQLNEGLWAIEPNPTGDFDHLSQAMNAMVHRIEEDRDKLLESVDQLKKINRELQAAQHETMQAEKLASTGRLAAGFAHEIGNPVAIVQGYLELLEQNSYSEDEQKEFVKRSLTELHRIDSLLFQLMDLSKSKPKDEQPINPFVICKDLARTLENAAGKANTTFLLNEISSNILVYCDPEQLRQVILNFFLNGIDAIKEKNSPEPGKIQCTVEKKLDHEKPFVQITISDNGTGINNEFLGNIFDPFFTTKVVGEGTGLGLSVAYRTIDSLGGTIEVESVEGRGTSFFISIPQYHKDTIDE